MPLSWTARHVYLEICGLQWSLPKLWWSRATSANPAVSCEAGDSSVSSLTGAGGLERVVAATAGERVDITGDGALTGVLDGSAFVALAAVPG